MPHKVASNIESFGEFVDRLDKKPIAEVSKVMFGVDVVKNLLDRQVFSPDFGLRGNPKVPSLREMKGHLVFIYDFRLKRNGINNGIFGRHEETKFLGEASSCTMHYTLWETFDGLHHAAFKNDKMNLIDKACLFGEVYYVPPEGILDLDRYYQNGVQFDREVRNFYLHDQEFNGKHHGGLSQRCHIYMGNPEHFGKYSIRMRPRAMKHEIHKQCWMN